MSETNPEILPRPANKSAYLFILIILKSSFNYNEIKYRDSWICLLEFMLHYQRLSTLQKYLIVQNKGI